MNYSRRQLFHMAASLAAGSLLQGANEKVGMIVRSARPEDLEMPLSGFKDYLTPVEHFFVRTHHYEPTMDVAAYKLNVGGHVSTPVSFTLDELKKMPKTELVSVCECAGNGRGLYEPSMPGLQWTYGSVGNARWGGVRLADVLKKAGVKAGAVEVLFDGADVPVGTMPDFQRTIPVQKALDPNTLLAYEMNGKPLISKHGFPLRAVVPGWSSDSWTKWLVRIDVLDKEFDGFFMKTAYRHPGKPVPPGVPVDPAKMTPVTSLRVKSVIGSPVTGQNLTPGAAVPITGAAWSGDKGPVTAVEVSVDGGRSWKAASLGKDSSLFGWRLFEYAWMPPAPGYYHLMARARTAADIQPFVREWNPSGYQNNTVQTVEVNITSDAPPAPPAAASQPAIEVPRAYRAACLPCHNNDVVEQQRLNRAQWDREITKMVNWGAQVKPEDRGAILDYLVQRFGYRPR